MSDTSGERKWTVLELLNWTTEYFTRADIEQPRLNAELLLSKVSGMPRVMLYVNFDKELSTEDLARFREMVKQRGRHYPLQYLTGHAEFYGRDFEVTPAVMVPRPETELVAAKCLEKIAGEGSDILAADIGTGSGVIGVTLACERPALRVAAVDASAEALVVARRNTERLGVAERMTFLTGDLCCPLRQEAMTPWLIASNPPYIPTVAIEQLQPEVRDFEPRRALDGGPDGLRVIAELVAEAAGPLALGGWLVLELGEGQAAKVKEMLQQTGAFDHESVEMVRDVGGCERVLAVRRKTE